MTQFPNKFKKPYFWPIFPIFGAKNIFLENLALSHTTSYGFLAPCQNSEKVNDIIQRICPDRWKDRRTEERKDRQTLFYRTFAATAGDPIKKIHSNFSTKNFFYLYKVCVIILIGLQS